MRKKVLIIGGAGYIGAHLTDLLDKDDDYEVTVYDNLLYSDAFLKDVNFIYGDIRDYSLLEKSIESHDIIWLGSALVGDGCAAINKQLSRIINEDIPKYICDISKDKFLIFASTMSVFGKNDNMVDEETEHNPLSVYAQTKSNAEKYIAANHPNHCVMRYGTIYGNPTVESRIRMDLVTNVLCYHAAIGKTLQVFGGNQMRPIMSVKSVASCIKYFIDNNTNGVYNVASENINIKEIAERIKGVYPETRIEYQEIQFEDSRHYFTKLDKLDSTGFNDHELLENEVSKMINTFKEKRVKDPENPIYHNANYMGKLLG